MGAGDQRLIHKPWGCEYCVFDNVKAAAWILHISRGHMTSLHCHPKKKTVLVCLQGSVSVAVNGHKETYGPLKPIEIPAGAWHQTIAHLDSIVMELEEPSDKSDIIRKEDAYGRVGLPIETDESL